MKIQIAIELETAKDGGMPSITSVTINGAKNKQEKQKAALTEAQQKRLRPEKEATKAA